MGEKFNREQELNSQETMTVGLRGKQVVRYHSPITPKENAVRTLTGKTPCWLGTDINVILPRIVPDNPARGIVFDGSPFDPVKEGGGPDWFGVEWVYEPSATGSMVVPGNPKVKDISHWEDYITFPDLDALDWEGAKRDCARIWKADQLNSTQIFTGFFERLISFLDFEDAAVAMIDEEEQVTVHRLFDRLADFYDALIGKLHDYIGLDHITLHDDWGAQRSPFFSYDTCEEMLLPYVKRVVESCHKRGMLFEFHSCGMIEPLVPIMIEAGMDSWGGQPINDKWKLYNQYGDQMCFTVNADATLDEEAAAAWADDCLSRLEPGKNLIVNVMEDCPLREILYVKSREYFSRQS